MVVVNHAQYRVNYVLGALDPSAEDVFLQGAERACPGDWLLCPAGV
jgi:hypothetical protein